MSEAEEHRSHLDLQINLLIEKTVSKILELVDALHLDRTVLRGGPDRQRELMSKPADAHAR